MQRKVLCLLWMCAEVISRSAAFLTSTQQTDEISFALKTVTHLASPQPFCSFVFVALPCWLNSSLSCALAQVGGIRNFVAAMLEKPSIRHKSQQKPALHCNSPSQGIQLRNKIQAQNHLSWCLVLWLVLEQTGWRTKIPKSTEDRQEV